MRPITFILSFLFVSVFAFAQSGITNQDQPKLVVSEAMHDFGKIPQGKPVFVDFKLKNITPASLSIDAVNASCGCTTPEWSKEPIAAGGSSVIKVGYNAASPGAFEKTITVSYEGGGNMMLIIKGEVWKTPDQSAPLNKSVAFLKTLKPISNQ